MVMLRHCGMKIFSAISILVCFFQCFGYNNFGNAFKRE